MSASNQSPSEFSFDIYPGLDQELDDAYRRNVENGVAANIATGGLAGVINDTLQRSQPELTYSPEFTTWVDQELDGIRSSWFPSAYGILDLQGTSQELLSTRPEMAKTLHRLFEAKAALTASGETTPGGENIGDTMHLTLLPWRAIRDSTTQPMLLVNNLRQLQGITTSKDYINDDLLNAIKQQEPLYRDPEGSGQLLSANEYLGKRIAKDGDWGFILTQTSKEAGLASIRGKSPYDLTSNGRTELVVAGHRVDGLGIFEWLTMSLQHDPRELSPEDLSWMLANRLNLNGVARVPCGGWVVGRVDSSLDGAGNRDDGVRPRLAVI